MRLFLALAASTILTGIIMAIIITRIQPNLTFKTDADWSYILALGSLVFALCASGMYWFIGKIDKACDGKVE